MNGRTKFAAVANRVVFRPRARGDLREIHDYIAKESPQAAFAFVEGLEARCASLVDFPEQGRARDDLLPGIRILPHDRRTAIVYRVLADRVEVLRFLYGGRDYEAILGGSSEG